MEQHLPEVTCSGRLSALVYSRQRSAYAPVLTRAGCCADPARVEVRALGQCPAPRPEAEQPAPERHLRPQDLRLWAGAHEARASPVQPRPCARLHAPPSAAVSSGGSVTLWHCFLTLALRMALSRYQAAGVCARQLGGELHDGVCGHAVGAPASTALCGCHVPKPGRQASAPVLFRASALATFERMPAWPSCCATRAS